MVMEASVSRLSAPSRHRERFRYSERPVSPRAERRAGACILRLARPIRSYRMNLTICVIIRHHMVVTKASVCRESAETRHRSRNPLLPRRSSARVKRGARSNRIAHGVGSERSIDKWTPVPPAGGVWW